MRIAMRGRRAANGFSNGWKTGRPFFQWLENGSCFFPMFGKRPADFSKVWKNLCGAAILLLAAAGGAGASSPPENAIFGTQRDFGTPAQVGDPLSTASGAFSWGKTLFALGGPMDLYFAISYRTDGSLYNQRDPGDFPPGYDTWNQVVNAWTWQPAPLADLGMGASPRIILPDGGQVCFKTNNAGAYVYTGTDGYGVYTGVRKSYQLQQRDGWVYFCDPAAGRVTLFEAYRSSGYRPVVVMDRNTNRLTYTYVTPNDDNPRDLYDEFGRELHFAYVGYQQGFNWLKRLAQVVDHGMRSWTFLYDTNAVDNDGRLTLRGIVGPDGQTHTFRYRPNNFSYEPGMAGPNPASNVCLLASVVEPLGNTTFSNEFIADSIDGSTPRNPRVSAQSDAYGHRTTLTMVYGGQNRYYGVVTNADGSSERFLHKWHHDYPAASIRDESGLNVGFGYNTNMLYTSVTDRLGQVTFFGYDAAGRRMETVTNAAGQALRLTYATVSQSFSNPYTNQVVTFEFDQLVRMEYPDGSAETFAYDGQGNATARVDRTGATWSYRYDARGRGLSTRNPLGGESISTYSTNGLLIRLANADGLVQTFGYDALFRVVAITNADGTASRLEYDSMDNVVWAANELGQTNTLVYDANGRLARATDPRGNAVTYHYDLMNRVTGVVDRAGGHAARAFDARGRPVELRSPDGTITRLGYAAGDYLATLAVGGSVWSNTYDAEGILVAARNPSGATTRYAADALGNTTNMVDALGRAARVTLDAMQRPVAARDPLQRVTTRTFDAADRPLVTRQPDSTFTSNTWDAAGNLVALRDLNGQAWSFQRSAGGRLEAITDPLGRRRDYHYDGRGNLVGAVFSAAGGGLTNTYQYDAAGRQTNTVYHDGLDLPVSRDGCGQVSAAVGVVLQRDPVGRVTNTIRQGGSVASAYDAAGRLVSIACMNGAFQVNYTYDATNGRLRRVSDTASGAYVDFAYDADLRMVRMARGNGIVATQAFDAAGQRIGLADGAILNQRMAYDPAGQATQVVASLPLGPAAYLAPGTNAFAYDNAAQVATAGYAYDVFGRLTNSPAAAYTWDGASRLVGIAPSGFGQPPAILAYDGLGARLSRVENGQTNRYLVSHALGASAILYEENLATVGDRRYYVWTPGGALLYSVAPDAGHAPRYYHYDLSGNTIALSDAAGAITDTYAYDPYGRLLARTGATPQPFAFAGRWGVRRDGSNDLYQAGRRWYDARTARFLSPEPLWPMIGTPGSINPYQYAWQSPVQLVDANGLAPDPVDVRAQGDELMREYDRLVSDYQVAVDVFKEREKQLGDAMRAIAIAEALARGFAAAGGGNLNAEVDPDDPANAEPDGIQPQRRSLLQDLLDLGEMRDRINQRAQAVIAFVAGHRAALQKALRLARQNAAEFQRRRDANRAIWMPAIKRNEQEQAGLWNKMWAAAQGGMWSLVDRGDLAGAKAAREGLKNDWAQQQAKLQQEQQDMWDKINKVDDQYHQAEGRVHGIESALERW